MNRIIVLLAGLVCTLFSSANDNVSLTMSGKILNISLENEVAYSTFQMDLTFPAGITVTAVNKASRLETENVSTANFVVDSEMVDAKVLRIVCYNTDNQPISVGSGDLLSLTLNSETTEKITANNIRFVNAESWSDNLLADAELPMPKTYTYSDIIQEDLNPSNYIITTTDRYFIQIGQGSDNALCGDNGNLHAASISTTAKDISQFVWHFEESDTEGEYFMCTETGMYVTFTGRSSYYGAPLSQERSDACKIKIGKAYTPTLSTGYWGIQEQQSGVKYGLNNLNALNTKFNWWTTEDVFTTLMVDSNNLFRLKKLSLYTQDSATEIANNEIITKIVDTILKRNGADESTSDVNGDGIVSIADVVYAIDSK